MLKIDNRINKEVLSGFIGNEFDDYKHDEFLNTNTVTGIVAFRINDRAYALTNVYEKIDFLGLDNEAAVLGLIECNWEDVSSLTQSNMIVVSIKKDIKSIIQINDHYLVFDNDEVKYDWWETRAIIFKFYDGELSFEKQVCWFSQEITINTGKDLLSLLEDDKQIKEDFEDSDLSVMVSREVINI